MQAPCQIGTAEVSHHKAPVLAGNLSPISPFFLTGPAEGPLSTRRRHPCPGIPCTVGQEYPFESGHGYEHSLGASSEFRDAPSAAGEAGKTELPALLRGYGGEGRGFGLASHPCMDHERLTRNASS